APIDVPVGSKLLVQIQGLTAPASPSANNAPKALEMLDSETQRAELILKEGDVVAIEGGGIAVKWPIALKPDLAPTSELKDPEATGRGGLRLSYIGKDDFGVTDTRLVITQGTETLELPLTAPVPTKNPATPLPGAAPDAGAPPAAEADKAP
ncbi:MAG TPA: DUF4175 family protein, partial [Pseudomonadota bacterium]|nr:DUF4175 family protein [Pseudomonadota bacterium]